ncbi:MBL fold metallo-hydrolase [Flavobacterium sp. MXW15]|uniref:MBL fold metallo-hydrolase n=1 Tax=Xanthomonas chitinilytica TaxID=2989819 RepID=A0ABT3JWY7_9XANT|nr:MBL fold metallo-hydrolase [Xanthomonas sp. H13-6]MCW4455762.1 MBL fold metallo-hydrolase [Flavobacterium sp. MXW15]MCW4472978.1 MBL fold metallo-hydrolase [Xanthomonas sp. H13-6]
MNRDAKIGPGDLGRRRFLGGCMAVAAAAWLPAGKARASADAALRIQRLAWAGIRLQLPGATLFIDPLVNPEAWGTALGDRLVPVDDSVGDTSVLITHTHSDHFDAQAAAQALSRGGVLAYPAGTQPRPVPAGARARPSPLWEPQLLGDFTATAVPASDGYGDTQVSWVVSAGGRRIFHGGDTLWHGSWWRIGRQFGPFDAAFLPVNGARFGWQQPASGLPGVLTPEQAVAAATILGARRLVPIHYGISGMKEYVELEDPIGRLRRAAAGKAPAVQVLAPGAWVDWNG